MRKSGEDISIFVVGVVLVGGLAYGGWHFRRWFNWQIDYKDQVESLIRERVKEECLR